jgi:hypothetical protein
MTSQKSIGSMLAIIVSGIAICTAIGTMAVTGYQAKDTTQQFRVHCANQATNEKDLVSVLSEFKTEVKNIKEQNARIERKLDRLDR